MKSILQAYQGNWKEYLTYEIGSYEQIGREVARNLGISWSSVWDFKQKLISGAVTPANFLTKPKILLFDIETAPILGHIWSMYPNFVGINQIQTDWFMLSYSAKWLGEKEIVHDSIDKHHDLTRAYDEDTVDLEVVRSLYALMNEADIVIGHNMKKFDNKKVKARLLKHGIKRPKPYRQIDTLLIARKEFALTSNKLDFLATFLGLKNKVAHEGHTLWTKCMKGDKKAWKVMNDYCIWDTGLLEEVYELIRHYDSTHPNLAVYYNDFVQRCNVCGDDDLAPTGKITTTNLGKYDGVECNSCGAQLKSRQNRLSSAKRANLLGNVIGA